MPLALNSPIEAVSGVDDLIRQVEESLPPEMRSVGSFLALAEITLKQLDEALRAVALDVAGDALNVYDLITSSTLDMLADTLALSVVIEEVKKAIRDAAVTRVRLLETIETLKPMDPKAVPPLEVGELFYSVAGAGVPYVPLYTAPYRFMNQAQAAWSVYTAMKGTFAIYMLVELRDRVVELGGAIVKAITPKIPFVLIAALLFAAGYYFSSRRSK